MARRLEFLRVTLTIDRDEGGNIRRHSSVQFGVRNAAPASGKEFDKRLVSSSVLPGFALDPAKRDAVLDDVVAAIRTEATLPGGPL